MGGSDWSCDDVVDDFIYFLNRLIPSFWIKVPDKKHIIYIVWFVVSLGVRYKLPNFCRCLKNMDLGKRCEIHTYRPLCGLFFCSLIFVVKNLSCIHGVQKSFRVLSLLRMESLKDITSL